MWEVKVSDASSLFRKDFYFSANFGIYIYICIDLYMNVVFFVSEFLQGSISRAVSDIVLKVLGSSAQRRKTQSEKNAAISLWRFLYAFYFFLHKKSLYKIIVTFVTLSIIVTFCFLSLNFFATFFHFFVFLFSRQIRNATLRDNDPALAELCRRCRSSADMPK